MGYLRHIDVALEQDADSHFDHRLHARLGVTVDFVDADIVFAVASC